VERIGKYEILEKIGQGAMGAVYRARDPMIGRDVAIKVIQDNALHTSDIKERFYREARSAGRLSHENITTIYDVGEDDGRPFIVMEYLEGTDLRSMMDPEVSHTTEEKLDVAIQICQGLHFAHRENIIHRDIKPDNIRVLPSGRIKIMDFGIARIQDDTEFQTLTLTGTSIGTPRYMSPEQIRGDTLDSRSYIFSFGVLFYELLSGSAPFFGDRVATIIYMILNVDPEPFEFDPKSVSAELQPILFKCLAKEKEDRYNDFTEILRDLQSVLRTAAGIGDELKSQILDSTISDFLAKDAATRSGQPVYQPVTRKPASSSRNRTWLVAGAVTLTVVAITIGVLVFGTRSIDPNLSETLPPDEAASSVSLGTAATEDIVSDESTQGAGRSDRSDDTGTENAGQAQPASGVSVARNDDGDERNVQQPGAPQENAVQPESSTPTEETVDDAQTADPVGEVSSQEEVARNEQEATPPDPTVVNAVQEAMLDAKGVVSVDMLQHPVFLEAMILENGGNEKYDSNDFEAATVLFRRAALGFVEAQRIRANLDETVAQLLIHLDSGYGGKRLGDLQAVHEFYASDYYATLFGIAVELSATTSASSIGVVVQEGSAVVSTQLVYKNNKGEEIGFERSEHWTFEETSGIWTLVAVENL